MTFIFREGNTKGIGRVTKLLSTDEDEKLAAEAAASSSTAGASAGDNKEDKPDDASEETAATASASSTNARRFDTLSALELLSCVQFARAPRALFLVCDRFQSHIFLWFCNPQNRTLRRVVSARKRCARNTRDPRTPCVGQKTEISQLGRRNSRQFCLAELIEAL